jgi:hypothetical protein
VTVEVGIGEDITVPLTLQKLGLGSLDLSVQPRNATILVDGRPVGSDAVTLPSVYQGAHTVSAELDGYQTARKQIVVEDGQSLAFHFELERTSRKNKQSTVVQIGGDGQAVASTAAADQDRAAAAEARRDAEAEEARRKAEEARVREEEQARREEEEARAEKEAAAKREADAQAAREAEEKREAEEARRRDEEAQAKRDEEARRREQEAARTHAADAEPARATTTRRPVARTLGGLALVGLGAGSGVASFVAYDSAQQAYDIYKGKLATAGTDARQQDRAESYYDAQVVPRRDFMYGAGAGAVALLAGGVVVLVIDSDGPAFVPAPGGGVLLWSGRF